MKDNTRDEKCCCGHTESNITGKNSHYDVSEAVYWIFSLNISPSELRLNCRLCSCKKYYPPTNYKTKYFGIGLIIFVAMIIIVKIFV